MGKGCSAARFMCSNDKKRPLDIVLLGGDWNTSVLRYLFRMWFTLKVLIFEWRIQKIIMVWLLENLSYWGMGENLCVLSPYNWVYLLCDYVWMQICVSHSMHWCDLWWGQWNSCRNSGGVWFWKENKAQGFSLNS